MASKGWLGEINSPPLEQLPVPERTFVQVNAKVEFGERWL